MDTDGELKGAIEHLNSYGSVEDDVRMVNLRVGAESDAT